MTLLPSYAKKGLNRQVSFEMGFGVGLPAGSARPESKGGTGAKDVKVDLALKRGGATAWTETSL
jgi:hypothetical protein